MAINSELRKHREMSTSDLTSQINKLHEDKKRKDETCDSTHRKHESCTKEDANSIIETKLMLKFKSKTIPFEKSMIERPGHHKVKLDVPSSLKYCDNIVPIMPDLEKKILLQSDRHPDKEGHKNTIHFKEELTILDHVFSTLIIDPPFPVNRIGAAAKSIKSLQQKNKTLGLSTMPKSHVLFNNAANSI